MHMTHTFTSQTKIVAGITALSIACVFGAPSVFADVSTSTHFQTRNTVTNDFGGSGASASYSSVVSGDEVGTGEASSANFTLQAGTMYFDTYAPQSQNWRWYQDVTNETPALPVGGIGENVAPAGVTNGTTIKLRITIANTSALTEQNQKFFMQFATSSGFESAMNVVEKDSCSAQSQWCYADGGGTDSALITQKVLSDADSCAGGVGLGCGTHNESGTGVSTFSPPKNASTEYEFTVQESGAALDTVYFFRAVDAASGIAVPLKAGAMYPSVSTEGGSLTFKIAGLPAATTTADVRTNVDTTSTSIPFGELTFGTSTIGAHRLTVSTNAVNGYHIFAYQMQGLVNQLNDQIAPVSATNLSPAAWSSACSAAGCYGYHTSANVLDGGSTRFAANDTYAQFRTDPDEVAYSSGPANGATTDIVYRVQVTPQQNPGSYSSNLVYIVTPIF